MSVYNGFSTREKETVYLKALYNMTFLLQVRIFKDMSGEKAMEDSSF